MKNSLEFRYRGLREELRREDVVLIGFRHLLNGIRGLFQKFFK